MARYPRGKGGARSPYAPVRVRPAPLILSQKHCLLRLQFVSYHEGFEETAGQDSADKRTGRSNRTRSPGRPEQRRHPATGRILPWCPERSYGWPDRRPCSVSPVTSSGKGRTSPGGGCGGACGCRETVFQLTLGIPKTQLALFEPILLGVFDVERKGTDNRA